MEPTQKLRSPVSWIGGKARIASKIVREFPDPKSYDVFCDPFCGSASVFFAKSQCHHLEVISDKNKRLINFWMAVREQVEYLQWKLQTLPYSEHVFKIYRDSLNNNELLEEIEEACRWFYVNRGTITGHIDSRKGWSFTLPQSKIQYSVPSEATGYQNAVHILSLISERLHRVQIHDWDFKKTIEKYQSRKTLFYIDSPYRGKESYYEVDGTPLFKLEDHKQLADLLNTTEAKVIISHYDDPELEEDYPINKWKRVCLPAKKELSRMNTKVQDTKEILLCNY